MKKIFAYISSICVFVFPMGVFAWEGEIKIAEENLEVGEITTLTVTIETNEQEEIELGTIPGIENFDILRSRSVQESHTSAVMNNESIENYTTLFRTLELAIVAKKEGEIVLGPVELKGKDTSQTTNTVKVHIVPKTAKKPKPDLEQKETTFSLKKVQKDNLYFYSIIGIAVLCIALFVILQMKYNTKNEDEEEKELTVPTNNSSELKLPVVEDENFYEKLEQYIQPFSEREGYAYIKTKIEKGRYSDELINTGALREEVREFTS